MDLAHETGSALRIAKVELRKI
ncbi:uncharacterized protein G2W53_021598 [Senna tora]|uniref:Uncharacterized protein n=1 Tax=Senna tora TaxID=362788 RepID=A0A834TT43_9FABA|nr:uncharacterized protein G2W53_021598 [Senna tora]